MQTCYLIIGTVIFCIILEGCPKQKSKDNNSYAEVQEISTVMNITGETNILILDAKDDANEKLVLKNIQEFSIAQYIDGCVSLTKNTEICNELESELKNIDR